MAAPLSSGSRRRRALSEAQKEPHGEDSMSGISTTAVVQKSGRRRPHRKVLSATEAASQDNLDETTKDLLWRLSDSEHDAPGAKVS